MAKLSISELNQLVSGMITEAKLSNNTFVETRDNLVGLLDKIGKIVTVDTVFSIDKLNRFDGEYLSFGKTVEEWYQDLILPVDYDEEGAGALAPHKPTYRPVFYSYTLGKKTIPTTIYNNDIERAVHFDSQLASLVATQYKRLEDSTAQYRYALKREMIGKFYDLCNVDLQDLDEFNVKSNYPVNSLFVYNGALYILVKPYKANDAASVDAAISAGYLIKEDLVQTIAKPVDTETGEAFIKQVKVDVESASDISEGHSLNGNTIGAVDGLVLIVKQGIMPTLDVDTLAGAFHLDKLALPVDVIVVKDFGTATKPYAVLMDSRAMRLHPTYEATRENFNGEGDFLNLFRQTENTAYISRNAFVKFYNEAE